MTTTAPADLAVLEREAPLPVYSGAQMFDALVAYKDLQAALDRVMPDQIIRLDDRPFRKKGYWRAIAVAFNLAVDCVSETRDVFGTLPDGSENYSYRVTYRASTQGGRSSIGDGACTAAEKSKGRMRATEHNVRSHAHTRALNRAIANLVAFGEVSAEEIEDDPAPPVKAASTKAIASVRAALAMPSYETWLLDLTRTAERGRVALEQFWQLSPTPHKKFLRENDAEQWMLLKQRAAKVVIHDDAPPRTA